MIHDRQGGLRQGIGRNLQTFRGGGEGEPPCEGPEPARREIEDGLAAVPPGDDELDAGGEEPNRCLEFYGECGFEGGAFRVCCMICVEEKG